MQRRVLPHIRANINKFPALVQKSEQLFPAACLGQIDGFVRSALQLRGDDRRRERDGNRGTAATAAGHCQSVLFSLTFFRFLRGRCSIWSS